jgi:hypothetical protein
MSWSYDSDTVHSQWKEFETFLRHAQSDNPAGAADLFGRPFAHPTEQPLTLRPAPAPEANYYLLQLAHLYEAGLINQQHANMIVNNIYG